MKNTTIHMKEVFSSLISSRKSISLLNDKMEFNKNQKYIFDFNGITFISRSFADEFVKFIEKKNILFDFEYTNKDVQDVLNIVNKTQYPQKRYFNKIDIKRVQSESNLDKLLASF